MVLRGGSLAQARRLATWMTPRTGGGLIAGIALEPLLQRRNVSGELAVQNAEQERFLYKFRYVHDTVGSEVRDAASV